MSALDKLGLKAIEGISHKITFLLLFEIQTTVHSSPLHSEIENFSFLGVAGKMQFYLLARYWQVATSAPD